MHTAAKMILNKCWADKEKAFTKEATVNSIYVTF